MKRFKCKVQILFSKNNITFKTVSGEMCAVTGEMTAPWIETTLPTLLSNLESLEV